MQLIQRRQAMALLGGAATVPLFGASARAASTTVVGALRFTSHAPNFIAFERGYYEAEGLHVEFKFFQAAQPMAVAIASGDADFAVTAISGGLISLAEKGATKVIGGALSEEPGIDGQMFLASDAAYQAGVTAPGKLDGKSFGVTQSGSSFHYVGAQMARAEGITPVFRPLQKVGTLIGALKSGQIDSWAIVPHIAKPLSASGAVHIIGNVSDYLPDFQVTTVFTSARNAAQEREKSQAFLRAYSRGAADYNAALVDRTADPEETEAVTRLIHKYVYADQPYEKAKPSIVNGSMRINPDARLNKSSVMDQLNWYKSEGMVKDGITFDTLVDPSYVEIV